MPTTPPAFVTFSGGDGQHMTEGMHATVCALVTAEAAKHVAWAEYVEPAVLLDEETAAFFTARLTDSKAATDDVSESSPPSKKNTKLVGNSGAAKGDVFGVICEHCSGAVPEISLRVACLDGTTLELTVAQRHRGQVQVA